MIGCTVEALGEDALLLRLGDRIDAGTNARVHALAAAIAARRPGWVVDLVPAYASLALFIDLTAFDPGSDGLGMARAWLEALPACPDVAPAAPRRCVEVAVRYGGEEGPDLDAVARHAGLSPEDVVRRHLAGDYQVAMLGFAAGFPYLIGLDAALAMPRLETPRTLVAAGSVGIGGGQTGIYPRSGPGGWRVIGRTAATLFDSQREPPALLAPGDRVRFLDARAVHPGTGHAS